ncbi:MAG: hypothetical protein MIO93_13135 [ANME-2 cluster archaeon]|jgi:hypothetical protein|nr:hypothetical protein [ANME-2 cluster archaeon]
MYPDRVKAFSDRAMDWLETAPITNTKEASQVARALCIWGRDARSPLKWLEQARSGDHWGEDNPVRNTARACTALMECGISCKESLDWLLEMQSGNGSWNDDVYDTCYCLMALGAAGEVSRTGVQWLLDNFSKDWKHPGVIALINSALIHQYSEGTADTISRNSSWLLAQCTDGHWKYTATSCLVVQSLILDERSENVGPSMDWLLDRLEESEDTDWKVSVVSLVLITLKMYYLHNTDQS